MTSEVNFLGVSGRRRRLGLALAVYACFTLGVVWAASPRLFQGHTDANHFALLAEAWLSGRLDLGGPPPGYTGNNDFALYEGRYYVVFPPFPALLIAPWVALGGGAARVRDGLFFLALSGLAPAILFLALEKLRRSGQSARKEWESVALALLFGFGSVYFFSAAQGSVWFAAHVVGAALLGLYLLFALGAERPLAAGTALGLAFATRTPMLFAAPLFVLEALRCSAAEDAPHPLAEPAAYLRALDRPRLLRALALFAFPLVVVFGLTLLHNALRFGDAWEVGYRYLGVRWQARIAKWGLFSYHYLAKNLGVMSSSLPWVPGARGTAFSINQHGLALWLTTPLYLTLLWPKRRPPVACALGLAALGAALPSLFYQNTGWLQFGYRFSNDYAPLLFALFAVSGWRFGRGVWLLAGAGLLINAFGAKTFGAPEYGAYYFAEPTQSVVYQPD